MNEYNLSDDLVQEYLAESREHLATIENDLLLIEQAGDTVDEQIVNRVFRAAHSVKGGAGFFGLTVIRELAHKIENVLDLVRANQIVPNSEIVSVLLLSFDKLRDLIENYAVSNQVDCSEFLTALTALAASQLPEARKALLNSSVALSIENASRIIEVPAFDLDQARRGGKSIYLVRYDMIRDFDKRGKTPLTAMRMLIKCGTIVDSAFDFDSAGTLEDEGPCNLRMEVLYATVLERDLIGDLVEVRPSEILVIERNGTVQPVGGPIVAETPKATSQALTSLLAPVAPPEPPPDMAAPAAPTSPAIDVTIRLNVNLLDALMNLAGELVLSRNELNDALASQDQRGVKTAAHRLSLVTSEIQGAVAQTRMQAVGTVFSKFPRLVRELSRQLGKNIQLQIEGGDVELDKTILEGLSDPLTHMVRNGVDHGIETPDQRLAAGKPATGTLTLRARHQAGYVVIEIVDDGRGLSPEKLAASCVKKGMIAAEQVSTMSDHDKMMLLFLPGSSTAEKVSDVSGRGVGMDVVKTNLDKLGGKIEIDSVVGRGTSFRIKLPLTLAIMPSLLVSSGGERFAIPQSSVGELIRVPASQRPIRIDHVGDAEVLVLRDRLVPLLHLADALGIDDLQRSTRVWPIVLVETGAFEYGLVVGELHDTVEIVVKPLGRHLQSILGYSGATILGDGCVAPILDVEGLASRAGLAAQAGAVQAAAAKNHQSTPTTETNSLLLFYNAPCEPCALPIEMVTRVESVLAAQIETLGGRRTMAYRGASLPLITLADLASVGTLDPAQEWKVIVIERNGASFGILAAGPLDLADAVIAIDSATHRQPGIAGSAILNGGTTLILDVAELAESLWKPASGNERSRTAGDSGQESTILLAEDSKFFRGQIQKLIEAVGYRVLAAEDGQEAWEILDTHPGEVAVVVTDLEMPRLGGLGLTRQIRADSRFASLPIIALSALAGEDEIAEGIATGVSEYQIKLDQDLLLDGIYRAIHQKSR